VTTRIGINGFGRIGRQTLKAIMERHGDTLEVVAINDLAPDETNAHLFKYDSTYGRYAGDVRAGDNEIVIDGRSIKSYSEKDPAALPWGELEVDIVVESTGIFTQAEKAAAQQMLIKREGPEPATEAGA
jgi:glyceraldehyde 3-phosphate dehydrogenase